MRKAISFWALAMTLAGLTTVTVAQSTPPKVYLLDAKVLADQKAKSAVSKTPTPLIQAIRKDAEKALTVGPFSVTQKEKVPPSGDKHDYVSQAPYWWPDPKKPDGIPYIRRDGERNPEAKANSDEERMNKTASAARALALGWYFTGEPKYADRAALLLRVFFLDPATRMNPNLNFGQGIPGKYPGGKSGIIETHTLPTVVDAVGLLAGSPTWTSADHKGMVDWFTQYLTWLRQSKLGREEADSKNNHGTWYDVQVADFALFIGERELATSVIRAAKEKRIATQVEPDGRQPLELARTKAFSYSCFNLNAMMSLATLGEAASEDLWDFQTKDGRSIRRALDFLVPYATGQKKWEYPQITGFNAAELAPGLLAGANHYKDAAYSKAADEINVTNSVMTLLLRAGAEGDAAINRGK
jgi:hypothetical protein